MSIRLCVLLLPLVAPLVAAAADPPMAVPFGPGEELVYTIDYGPVNAGEAALRLVEVLESGGIDCYRVDNTIRSNRVFSALYRVRDKAVSHFSTADLTSRYFAKRLREGDFSRNVQMRFDPAVGKVVYKDGREYEIPPDMRDVLSATYYLRTVDLQPDSLAHIAVHSSRKNYDVEIITHGRETVEVPAGVFDCIVVEPIFMGEGLFQYEGKLTFWVSDDEYRIPVLIKTKVKVGAIEASLKSFTPGTPLTDGGGP